MSTVIKKILDDRIKHRLIGFVVVLSLMIIFLPAMLRQSNQRFDEVVSFRVPKKPVAPQMAMVDKAHMFKTVKVATVTIPTSGKVQSTIAQAQPLSEPVTKEHSAQMAKIEVQKQHAAESKAMHVNEVFTIQLASFSQEANAQALVTNLKSKGFAASAQMIAGPTGELYQVIVGQLKQREQAIDLQKKLVNNTQLNGLIIKTKVS
ncbi:MAG: hypothetical protein CK424_01205 [Legionella sp.]|nr:MAG: hypothetical protein CK424_01205 [Legionella sp.]